MMATVAVEVCTRPLVSVAGTRCTRCTPDSYFSLLYTLQGRYGRYMMYGNGTVGWCHQRRVQPSAERRAAPRRAQRRQQQLHGAHKAAEATSPAGGSPGPTCLSPVICSTHSL